jgi:hypothetical protein
LQLGIGVKVARRDMWGVLRQTPKVSRVKEGVLGRKALFILLETR